MNNYPGQPDTTSNYLSYLVRLWHTHSEGVPVWRASLEDPLTRYIWRFDSLPGLFAFLRDQTGAGDLFDDTSRDNLQAAPGTEAEYDR